MMKLEFMIQFRNEALDERAMAPRPDKLSPAHVRILEHLTRGGIVAGWGHWWDEVLLDLEAWGLMKGKWIGSLRYDAHPYWSITKTGEDALKRAKEQSA